ncbi:hypothetical protein LDFHOB_09790 [Candidatus Electronema aureum]
MDYCVKNILVAPFIDGFMQNAIFNKETCMDMKKRLAKE